MGKGERFYADIMSVHPEVTGSCNFVSVRLTNGERFNFIVDFGLFQETDYIEQNKKLWFKPYNINFAIVTHAHADHIGRLPFLVKKGYRGCIYTTDDTKTIMAPALYDSARVLKENAKKYKERPLYTESDVKGVLSLVRGCGFNQWYSVNDHVDIMFFGNGHLYGAAMVLVKIKDDRERKIYILFTGDYNNKNLFFDLKSIPQWVYGLPLTIVQESTYGYMNSW